MKQPPLYMTELKQKIYMKSKWEEYMYEENRFFLRSIYRAGIVISFFFNREYDPATDYIPLHDVGLYQMHLRNPFEVCRDSVSSWRSSTWLQLQIH